MNTFPPRHICIVSALLISVGVSSVIEMIAGIFDDRFEINFGFVFIVIGYGLLIGRSSSRKWALIYSFMGLIAVTMICTWHAYFYLAGKKQVDFSYYSIGLTLLISATVTSLYSILVLKSKRHLDWFGSIKEDTVAAKSITLSVALVVSLIAIYQHLDDWEEEQNQKKMFTYDIKIIPYNTVTGEGLRSFSHSNTSHDFATTKTKKHLTQQVQFTSTENGIVLGCTGTAARPFTITLQSEGFYDQLINIDANTGSQLRIPMQPIPSEN